MSNTINKYLTEREINILKKFCDYQLDLLNEGKIDDEDIKMSFEFNNITISNPFVDESGRFEVDPVKYYGESFLKSKFMSVFI